MALIIFFAAEYEYVYLYFFNTFHRAFGMKGSVFAKEICLFLRNLGASKWMAEREKSFCGRWYAMNKLLDWKNASIKELVHHSFGMILVYFPWKGHNCTAKK